MNEKTSTAAPKSAPPSESPLCGEREGGEAPSHSAKEQSPLGLRSESRNGFPGGSLSVLFVCLGNICRSPTAEATFVAEVERRKLAHRFHIDSCGTGAFHVGEPAHHETRATAKRRGVEITHRARVLVAADLDRFDWLLAMDESNARNILKLARTDAHEAKVRLFRSWDPERDPEHPEVPDPYHTGEFDRVFDICARTSRALLDALTA